jgi:tetratricopeptide (TPR) repeat protein
VEEHPSSEDFARFLQQSSRPSEREQDARVVRHLLAGCAVCRRTLRRTKGLLGLLGRLLEFPVQVESEATQSNNYEWTFAKAERAFATLLAKGPPPEQVPELLAELERLGENEQIRRVSTDHRFADPELIHCLIGRSHDARYRSPRKTLHFARLAKTAAEGLTPAKTGGEAPLADMRAKAWGQYANSLRIAGRPLEAQKSFATSESHRRAGSGDLTLHGWLLLRITGLAIFMNQYAKAIEMAETAGEICREAGSIDLLAGTMIQKAIALLYSGEAEVAITILLQAIPLIDPKEDPHLLLAAKHNLTRCYLDLDRPDEALAFHYNTRCLYQECPDPLIQLRAVWQEGQLLREIGHCDNAETSLLRAHAGFMRLGLVYEASLVSLDLAALYSKLGRVADLRQVLAQVLPIFRTLRVDQELIASFLWLQNTLEAQAPET